MSDAPGPEGWGEAGALQPLVAVLAAGPYLRVVARAAGIEADTAAASAPARLDIGWDADSQARALAAAAATPTLPGGHVARACGAAVVVEAAPAAAPTRLTELVAAGWLSELAARTLSASVAIGRNVLLCGPWAASVTLGTALMAAGPRPGVLQPGPTCGRAPVPPGWLDLESTAAASWLGAAPLAAWSLDAAALVAAMGALQGVIGWIGGGRLERALTRLEAAVPPPAPLRLLAGLDLVVVLEPAGAPRVREVAEILLAADGYRPQLLFGSGAPSPSSAAATSPSASPSGSAPAPAPLLPLALPSFAAALSRGDDAALVADLVAATRAPPGADAAPAAELVVGGPGAARAGAFATPSGAAPTPARRGGPGHFRAAVRGGPPWRASAPLPGLGGPAPSRPPLDLGGLAPAAPLSGLGGPAPSAPPLGLRGPAPAAPGGAAAAGGQATPTADADFEPGWELDRLALPHDAPPPAAASAEDAALTASLGLAPPPRPAGARGPAPDFARALRAAGGGAERPAPEPAPGPDTADACKAPGGAAEKP